MDRHQFLSFLQKRIGSWEQATARELSHSESALLSSVDYNNLLASSWVEGSPARRPAADSAEYELFLVITEAIKAQLLLCPPSQRIVLVLDWGAGNGKVIPWLRVSADRLNDIPSILLVYLYIDFSPVMLAIARREYDSLFNGSNEKTLALFALTDVMKSQFSEHDWQELRTYCGCVLSICAGGTIGNLGTELDGANHFQRTLLKNWYPCDHILVTFLNPAQFRDTVLHYTHSGLSSGRFDTLFVSLYALSKSQKPSLVTNGHIDLINLHSSPTFQELHEGVRDLGEKPYFVIFEMRSGDKSLGQVSRHYSSEYVKQVFLENYNIVRCIEVSSARCYWLRTNCAPLL
ncbi:MAG: hypothetical protein JO202_02985 [Ktedonobacteraceae bacterium]|nr:hypothetical protein [Ktedonobacteraceae bacterium]